mgnify:CR=1 FL=1
MNVFFTGNFQFIYISKIEKTVLFMRCFFHSRVLLLQFCRYFYAVSWGYCIMYVDRFLSALGVNKLFFSVFFTDPKICLNFSILSRFSCSRASHFYMNKKLNQPTVIGSVVTDIWTE